MAKQHCPHCGASMVEYKRSFTKGLADSLRSMALHGGHIVPVCDLNLDNSQYSAFAKLRLWGLAESVNYDGDVKQRGGYWSITKKGWEFLRHEIKIPKYVIEYRMDVIDQSEEEVAISDMLDGWWYRPKVISESRPH